MNFAPTEDELAFAGLAAQILTDSASHDRLREIEAQEGPRFDPKLWREMAEAGLLGIAIPELYGGSGQGFFELSRILEEIGRRTAPIPLLESAVLGALPIAEFGSEAQKQALLPGAAQGELILTSALVEDQANPTEPVTRAHSDGKGFRLEGRKVCVPAGQLAHRLIVPATLDDRSVGLFIVDPETEGVEIVPLLTTSGQPEATLELTGARMQKADRLGAADQGAEILHWIRERGTAALCSLALGVCEEALRLTAEYTKSRKQFGQPIATFQAVGQRQADAYVDTEAVRLTAWQAAWRISANLPASEAVAVAKYWAAEGGQRVVHSAAHLHGGMGVDRDYPLHRYFLYAKQLELSLGGATYQLRSLGRMLAQGSA
ncbi:MAG: acyl-CoA/acyl-ACP dehydrogenase [Myxococcota bacterium]|nr:acyl-CoA/acyl-ACP dehydrogenase [Myxococcota bacterium]